jgi:hypothetical protein
VKRVGVSVIAHAGYRGEELPRSFFLEDRKIEIIRIDDQWLGQDAEGGNRRRCFRVKAGDGHTYVLCCYDSTGDWYLE